MKPALLPTIELGYGHGSIQFNYDSACFDILAPQVPPAQPLSDSEIGAALDAPIDSSPLEDLIAPGHTVLIVASDATRATGGAQIINLLVRRLIQNGITVDGVHGTVLDGVTVQGAKLDGIHVRSAGVILRNCTVDMLGNRIGQGIDISFNMDMGMSMVEGCTIMGGQEGITTHSSMTDIMGNRVSRTTGEAIAVDEMSMGMASHNTVRDALGVALYCGDRSMCMFDHNTVVGTQPDTASGLRTQRGFGVLASFQSEADLWQNRLVANPVAAGEVTHSTLRTTRAAGW